VTATPASLFGSSSSFHAVETARDPGLRGKLAILWHRGAAARNVQPNPDG
jgi:hypothetical protein